MKAGWLSLRIWSCMAALGLAGALTGCSGFFVPENGSGSGSGSTGGGSTGTVGPDYVYVGNAGTSTVTGFLIGSGTNGATLTQLPNMPYNVAVVPSALAVHPTDKFLYVATVGAGPAGGGFGAAIYCYPINSDGSLGASTSTSGVAIVSAQAMDISSDGNWMFVLDSVNNAVDVYQINQTTGSLSNLSTSLPFGVTGVPDSFAVKVAPSGGFIVAALGQLGDVVFNFSGNTATGAASLANVYQINAFSTATSDNALAIDSTSTHLYIARTGISGGVAAYTIGSGGALQALNNGTPYTTGSQPTAVTLDGSGRYVYVANGRDGTISGFTIGPQGTLTPLSGSPYAYSSSGSQVSAIGADNSTNYILATSFNSTPDLTMFSFDTTVPGKLDIVQTQNTGQATSATPQAEPAGAVVLAMSH